MEGGSPTRPALLAYNPPPRTLLNTRDPRTDHVFATRRARGPRVPPLTHLSCGTHFLNYVVSVELRQPPSTSHHHFGDELSVHWLFNPALLIEWNALPVLKRLITKNRDGVA